MRRQIASAATALLALSIGSFDANVSATPWSIGVLGRARVFTASVDASINRFLGAKRLAQTQDPAPVLVEATIKTDKRDYDPGEIVEVTGAGWAPGEDVRLTFEEQLENPHPPSVFVARADQNGGFVDTSFTTEVRHLGVSLRVYALGLTSGQYWVTSFVDAVSADLDQCANGPLGAPVPCIDPGTPSGPDNPWQNGNLNQNQAHYNEGDSVPYRLRMTGLAGGSHTVTIEWDTTEGGKHTLDYLTSFDRTETTAAPCDGFGFCSDLTPDLFPIGADPNVVNAGVTPIAGNFALFNGDITNASAYTLDGLYTGNSKTRITLTFSVPANTACLTAGKNDPDPTDCPVLAWGGHIATRQDWGNENSAVTRTGSPYHMRLLDLDGTGGNQDRSLSAEAVIFPGSLTIVKQTVPALNAQDFGFTTTGGLIPANFSLDTDADGTLSDTQTFANILVIDNNGNNYTVSETPEALWTLSFPNPACTVTSGNGGSTGSVANGVSVNLREGENVTCTFINTRQSASLTLVKEIVNDNGGTETDRSKWQLTATGTGSNVHSGPGSAGQLFSVDPDTYTLSETGSVAGYTNGTTYSCVKNGVGPVDGNSITLANGDSATCTIRNDDQAAHLTLVKNVVNNNGGTKTVADFPLTADGTGSNDITGVSATPAVTNAAVNADTFALSEVTQTGYTASAWTCVGGSQNGSNITLTIGQSATCTITNDDQGAQLTLVKNVVNDNGGTRTVADFPLTADGTGSNDITGVSATPAVTNAAVDADTFALSEVTQTGYTASAWTCVGGSQNGSNITLALGQSATCTITNDDQAAHLTLVKNVVNDNGGTKTVADFPLTADGAGGNDITGVSAAAAVTNATVNADTFALSEVTQTGYTASAWSCVGGTQNGSNITLGLGESATCTITNDDQPAHLTLVKNVVNDNGGTKTIADFPLTADGTGSNDITGVSAAAAVTNAAVNADTFALSEVTQTGYTASAWICVGGSQNGSNITLTVGQSATCTITNDDQAAHLTLVKNVVNDNGGTKTVADFPLTANGTGSNDITGVSATAAVTNATVNADTFALSEVTQTGYTASAWSCVGGTQNGSNITLGLGESATCTITNDDQAAHLTLVKNVVNNNGGTRTVADFPLTADGTGSNDITGISATAAVTNVAVNADTFALSEVTQIGYTASAWTCNGGTQNGSNITLAVGQSATCTITNDDQAAHLTLVKYVVNNNGGTRTVSDFPLTADGTGSNDITGVSATAAVTNVAVNADTFALSEVTQIGYTASAWTCNGGTQNGSNITLAVGQSATCSITNDDQQGTLQVVKRVINDHGGTKVGTDFGVATNAGTLVFGGGVENPAKTFTYTAAALSVNAGSYTLRENDTYGYSEGVWYCTGGTLTNNTINLGAVTVPNGIAVVCTITNNDDPGTIVVIKNATPAQGNFSFTTTGTGYNGFGLTGATANNGNKNTQSLSAGSYTVKEATQLGWVLTGIGGSTDVNTPYNCVVTGSGGSSGVGDLNTQTASIVLKNGDTVTCTFENTGSGASRTQGFWATHLALARVAWEGGTAGNLINLPGVGGVGGIGDTLICGRDVDASNVVAASSNQLMGGFWSSISTKADGKKRLAIDQGRMQLLQQLLAAELNASAFGSLPAGGSAKFAEWETALCGTNTAAISKAQSEAAAFNSKGDSTTFTPGTSADSKTGRFVADRPFWDIIKP